PEGVQTSKGATVSRPALYLRLDLVVLAVGPLAMVLAGARWGPYRAARTAGGGGSARPLYPRPVTVVELALYALLLAVAAVAVWRRPLAALYLFVVGLALHNAVMAALYAAGVRGDVLTAITAWKEILLVVALARVGRD